MSAADTTEHQSPDSDSESSKAAGIDLGARGGLATGPRSASTKALPQALGAIELSARTGVASDYIYRGVTLSVHRPAGGAALEAALGLLYASSSVASVSLPTQPAGELTIATGIRPKVGALEFDFAQTWFVYLGEQLPGKTAGVNYMELSGRADAKIAGPFRVAAMIAYSPNVSNTGAWSKYAAFGASYDIPEWVLPNGISASLSGGVGYSWFGRQSLALGGYRLPAYTHWSIGATLSKDMLNFDLRYSNTSLSKERCYVFTGDPGAMRGGRADAISNPDGLMSRWCGQAVVAKVWIQLN